MIYDFKIIMLKWHHNRGDFIFAKHMGNNHNFSVPDGSIFGDIPVYHYKAIRSLSDENDSTSTEIFVFRPTAMEWLKKDHFFEGQEVKLEIDMPINP